jgi:hypothetical protein
MWTEAEGSDCFGCRQVYESSTPRLGSTRHLIWLRHFDPNTRLWLIGAVWRTASALVHNEIVCPEPVFMCSEPADSKRLQILDQLGHLTGA